MPSTRNLPAPPFQAEDDTPIFPPEGSEDECLPGSVDHWFLLQALQRVCLRRSMLRSGQVKEKTAQLSQHAHTCMFHAFVDVLHPCVLCALFTFRLEPFPPRVDLGHPVVRWG